MFLVAVQNYITAILLFLVVEMLMTWGFYGGFSSRIMLYPTRADIKERLLKQKWRKHRI